MENKFYIKKLDSYEKASEISKIRMGTEPSYDLDLLPSVQMQKEMRKFLKYRGQQLGKQQKVRFVIWGFPVLHFKLNQ